MSRVNSVVFGVSAACLLAGVTCALMLVSPAGPRAPLHTAASGERIVGAISTISPPFLIFRTLAPRQAYGRVAMLPATAGGSARHVTNLLCDRVHFAGGTGLCLVEEATDGLTVKHGAYFFDRTFSRVHRVELSGVPIRARVSPDGRRAGVTVYAEEETPAGERLASKSIIIDLSAGRALADLREFSVANRFEPMVGPIDAANVAFAADGDSFFATLSTSTQQYLVSGSVDARRMTVVTTGVANEGLSPDGKRLVVKKRVGDRGYWRLLVLDLDTLTEHPLEQGQRSVDDQVEWLDESHVVYHDATEEGTGVWVLSTNGIGGPRLLVADAYSPAVQR